MFSSTLADRVITQKNYISCGGLAIIKITTLVSIKEPPKHWVGLVTQQETKMNGLFDIAKEPFNMLPMRYRWFVHELSKRIDCKTQVWMSEREILERANGASVFSGITTS